MMKPAWGAMRKPITAANAAPLLAPMMNGSTSGLRNTPWKIAPATLSAAPTSAAEITRGSRISRRIVASASVQRWSNSTNGSESTRMCSVSPSPIDAEPAAVASATAQSSSSAPSP